MSQKARGQYKICPNCGLNIDFGEKCDCKKEIVVLKYHFEEILNAWRFYLADGRSVLISFNTFKNYLNDQHLHICDQINPNHLVKWVLERAETDVF